MKNNINFFTHDTNAGSNPKMKALIATYGFEGYGRFWRLNELIGASPDCKLDISRRIYLASVADELRTSPDELEKFVNFLCDPDECGLLQVVDNVLTTDRTQDDLSTAMKARTSAKARRGGASPDELRTSPDERETSPDETHEGRKGRKEGKLATTEFQTWLQEWVRENRNYDQPSAFVRKVLKNPGEYPDIVAEFESHQPKPPPPPPPDQCDLCGSTLEVSGATAECPNCGRVWGRMSSGWQPLPNTGKPPSDDYEDDYEAAPAGLTTG